MQCSGFQKVKIFRNVGQVSKAKQKIKQWFAKERREEAIEEGKDSITREARRTGLPLQRLVSADSMGALARELRYADVTALYAAVGEGHVSAQSVVHKLVAALGGEEGAVEDIAETALQTARQAVVQPAGEVRPARGPAERAVGVQARPAAVRRG